MNYKGKKLRHELKYYINYHEYEGLKNRFRILMEQDPNAMESGSYHIRSLYFDDAYDSALYDKNFGVQKRIKYRIRIYNKSDRMIRLERKAKYDQYICKESGSLSVPEYRGIMENRVDFLLKGSGEVFKDFYVQYRNNVLRPKVIVDYDREAYIWSVSDVRITFDKKLRAGINSNDIFDKNLITVNAFEEPVMILEVKYNDFLPDNIRALLRVHAHENSAISKYVICRTLKDNINQGAQV